jgi:hypothetical protein
MAKLPPQKRILPENFPDQSKWIPRLLEPMNRFMEDINRALNNQLTFSENLSSEVRTVQVDGNYPLRMPWALKAKPIGAWIIACREISGNHTVFTTPLFLDWEYNEAGQFQINSVVGLTATATDKFNLTYIAITG